MTTLWHLSHGHESFPALHAALASVEHGRLAAVAANTVLNDWCADVSDCLDGDDDPHGHGKRLPYIGWFWRSVDFANRRIPIGDCGDFIGFMENNKWGHPARNLTDSEADQVIGLLWQARTVGDAAGSVREVHAARDRVLVDLWDLMQTFTVPERDWL